MSSKSPVKIDMDTADHIASEFTVINAFAAIAIAFAFIAIMSFVREPQRQKINAIIMAGAGGVYWNGGLGVWEFVFGVLILLVAFNGLRHYYFIGIGWLLHTVWDTSPFLRKSDRVL